MSIENNEIQHDIEEVPIQNNISNPNEKFSLVWKDLDLKIDMNTSKKLFKKDIRTLHILKGISGYAESGECLAIMGGSGAGKSTLLNIISGRFDVEKNMRLSGNVKLNGQEMEWKKYRNIIGFVMQKDLFMESLQVDEIFKFVIDLTDTTSSQEERQEILKKVIRNLKMEKAQSNRVGGEFKKGISGGEKRRLNIGFELLKNPKILFLDEPTSGLDSYTSYIIVKLLKRLARERNMIIIYTIHQPSYDIGELFDRLMILNKGKISFYDNRQKLEQYYESLGEGCPDDVNPLDHAIDVALTKGQEVDEKFFNKYETDPSGKQYVQSKIQEQNQQELDYKTQKASFFKQFGLLSKRAFINFIRTPMTFGIRLVQVIFIAVFFILLFWRMDDVDFKETVTIQNRLGALFFVSINMFIMYFQTSVALFPIEREIFLKEYDSGLYGIVPYYLSKLMIDLPLTALFPALFSAIVYYAVNLNNPAQYFFMFMLGTILLSWLATLFGIFIGTIAKNANVAIEIAPMIFVPIILFSGYTTNTENIKAFLKWIEFMSPVRYIFEFFVHNEFGKYENELQNPEETLNFNLKIWQILLILACYITLLMVLSIISLYFGSRKGLKN